MRIISGKYKGRVIPHHSKLKARPTTDKAKESLFNILNFELDYEDLNVLDLFSGTGSISFEFLSRGAASVTAVEKAYQHTKYIQNTAQILDVKLNIVRADVFQFLNTVPPIYNLIFADPPYDLPQFEEVLPAIRASRLAEQHPLLILEHSEEFHFQEEKGFLKHKKYGKVNFSFFEL